MQIPSGNLSLRSLTYDLPASGQKKQPQSQEQTSQRSESLQVIDAEFVDIKQNSQVLRQDLESLNLPDKPVLLEESSGSGNSEEQQELVARFQTKDLDTPAPGTYISIYA